MPKGTIYERLEKGIKEIKTLNKEKVKEEVKEEILHERIQERYRGIPVSEKIVICLKILFA